MDLLQLEHFLAVAEEGSFTRAAERVFRTQPAVSQSVKTLEEARADSAWQFIDLVKQSTGRLAAAA